jgi:hypothetical protein
VTYLELCQRAAVECGVASRTAIKTALPNVASATGSLGRVVNWVGDAWNELQLESENWSFMRSSNILGQGVSFLTIAGQPSYFLGTDPGMIGVGPDAFSVWDEDSFRCFPTAVGTRGEMFLDTIDYEDWRNGYMLGAMRSVQTRPVAIAIGPNQSLHLGPPPTDAFTVTGDYYVAPSEMVLDTDLPAGLPPRFHMLIVYRMMLDYAGYESAPEVYDRAFKKNAVMHSQLLGVNAPRMTAAGALA